MIRPDTAMNVLRHNVRILLTASLLALPFAHWTAATAQEPVRATPSVNPEVLESKIKEVEATKGIDEATSAKLTELYRRALTNLEKARSDEDDANTLAQARKTAPADTAKLREAAEKLGKAEPQKGLKLSEATPLAELEQQLQKEKADLAAVEAKLSSLKEKHELLVARPAAARQRLIEAKKQQEEVASGLKAPPPAGELAAVTEARGWALQTRGLALTAEIRKLDQELLSHQVRLGLLEAQQEEAALSVAYVSARVRMLEETLSKRRLVEAEAAQQQAEAIREELEGKHPVVRELAERNAALTEELAELATQLESVSVRDDEMRVRATKIEDELRSLKEKLRVAGLTQAVGQVLFEQRRALPDLGTMRREALNRESQVARTGLRQIQLAEERGALRNLDRYVAEMTSDLPAEEAETLRLELWDLSASRRELVNKASESGASYLRALGEVDLAQRQLIDAVEAFDEYLATRLLWIRSTDPVSLKLLSDLPAELARLLSPSNWLAAGTDMLRQLGANPPGTLLILALLVVTSMRGRFLKAAVATGEKIGRVRTDSFAYTLQAVAWTALASAPLPLLLLATGWQLSLAPEASGFSGAVAAGLMGVAPHFLFLLFFADVGVAGGLTAKHYRWPAEATAKMRREFRLLMVLFLPAVFITIHTFSLGELGSGTALGMLGILTAIAASGVFLFRFFTPRGGVLAEHLTRHPRSLLARMRPVWFTFLIAIPSALFALVLAGYLYTGGTLTRDLLDTLWLIFGLVLIRELVVRWLLVVRRRLAFQAALEKREAARAAREAAKEAGESAAGGDDMPPEVEEPEVDLAALDAQSRKLLDTAMLFAGVIGLWLIWSRVMPAFGILDDVSLWSQTAVVDGVEKAVPVTLADLALALIVGIVTVVAARGLPAFIEFILLNRTAMTAGARYTVTTLLGYVIVGVGVVAFFSILGGSWSQIQWLVAALGVGIGFGLQEIVANFISGLIILFERPIRVGDTVTVGDTTGVVSRIKIRATTITNWDRQELLVPNKEFITTRLLNWSLSDPITRIRVPVGVAYGSDVANAMILMKEAAEEHDNVLDDPAPSVTFESFGDNALQLFLRAFLPSMENRIATVTDLHTAINARFNEAGIVIAFPQRDVHLDTSEPLDVRVLRDDAGKE